MSMYFDERPMMPFERWPVPLHDDAKIKRLRDEARVNSLDFDEDVALRLSAHPGRLLLYDRYLAIRERIGSLWHLSIRPVGDLVSRSWKQYQQIKNELVGPETIK